jgi:hypothetical protein
MEFPSVNQNDILGIVDEVKAKMENPLVALAGASVLGAGIIGTSAVLVSKKRKSRKKKKKKSKSNKRKKSKLKFGSKAYRKRYLGKNKKRITHTRRGWRQDRKRRSKQKWEVAYQKRKKRSGRHSKKRRFVKGSKEAKAYMAKLRRMRK